MVEKSLYIKTYGCQMNVYDSERMADILKPLGYKLVDSPAGADLVILNTCHIREKAEEKTVPMDRISRRLYFSQLLLTISPVYVLKMQGMQNEEKYFSS